MNVHKNPLPNPLGFIREDRALEILGISRGTLTNWRKSGIIKSYKVARHLFFKEHELIKAIENAVEKFH
jgi:predicted site-specific integrase-resolvase